MSARIDPDLSRRAHAAAAQRTISWTELVTAALERELGEEARCSVCRTHAYRQQQQSAQIDNLDARVSALAATARAQQRKLDELGSMPLDRLGQMAVRTELVSMATEIVERLEAAGDPQSDW